MIRRIRRGEAAAFALVYTIILAASSSAVHGQSSGQALKVPAAIRLKAALDALCERYNLAFVVEGSPIVATPDVATPRRTNLPLELAVEQVAKQFDYTSSREGRVVTLTKRYTNKSDLPDVTPEECGQALSRAASILASFEPHFEPLPPGMQGTRQIAALVRSLTPQQSAGLSVGLPIASLSEQQREQVSLFCMFFMLGQHSAAVMRESKNYDSVMKQDPKFSLQQSAVGEVFGYEAKMGALPQTRFYPISHREMVWPGPPGNLPLVRGKSFKNGMEVPPEDISELKGGKVPFEPSIGADTLTISEVCALLTASGENARKYSADKAVQSKRITIIGANRVLPDYIAEALARIYGLRIVRDKAEWLITTPATPQIQAIADLKERLPSVVPRPLLLYLQMRMVNFGAEMGRRASTHIGSFRTVGSNFEAALLQSLRADIEPKLRKKKEQSMLLSNCTGMDRNMFGMALFAAGFAELWSVCSRELPYSMAHFNEIVLTGEYYTDDQQRLRLNLNLCHRDSATGRLRHDCGVRGARVPQ